MHDYYECERYHLCWAEIYDWIRYMLHKNIISTVCPGRKKVQMVVISGLHSIDFAVVSE